MAEVGSDNEISMPSVELEDVVTPLVVGWLERECLILGLVLARIPTDFDAFVFVANLLVVVHAERDRLSAVFERLRLQPPRLGGGGGAEVGVDGRIGLAPRETLAGELVEGDVDVRGEESEEFVGVFLEGVCELTREILLQNCFHEHQTANN